MNLDGATFWRAIDSELQSAQQAVDELEDLYLNPYDGYEAEEYAVQERLASSLETLRSLMAQSAQILGLNRFDEELSRFWSSTQDSCQIEFHDYYECFYSPVLIKFRDFIRSFAAFIPNPNLESPQGDSDLYRLEAVLKSTGHIINLLGVKPRCENDVRNAVYKVLRIVFENTVREVPISNSLKNFKIDIGVESLACAIEYKYANTEAKARNILDGIYTDVHGYSGSEIWKNFYAVLYMTEAFVPESAIREDWVRNEVPENWQLIIVSGQGELKPNAPMIVKNTYG